MVGRVRNGETPPFRPRVPPGSSVDAVDSRLVDLMQQCWLEDPAHRPTVAAILARFTDITQIQSVQWVTLSFLKTKALRPPLFCVFEPPLGA